jgi:hypothetical protein
VYHHYADIQPIRIDSWHLMLVACQLAFHKWQWHIPCGTWNREYSMCHREQ